MNEYTPEGWTPEEWQAQMHADVKVAYRLVELGMVGDPDTIAYDPEETGRIDAEYDEWKAEVERAAAAKAEAERDAALSTIAAIEAILPGPRTWAESLSRMPDGSMWPQTVDAEKIRVAIALGSVLSTGRETNERETDGSRGEQLARRGDAERH